MTITAESVLGRQTLTLRNLQLPQPRRDFVWVLRFRIETILSDAVGTRTVMVSENDKGEVVDVFRGWISVR